MAEDKPAELDAEEAAQKSKFKDWAKEAFTEWVTEREEAEKEAPNRTDPPSKPSVFKSLFGG